MAETKTIQEQHTVGPPAIGFDYQFYYFMLLALDLKFGQKIGFEVKDDVHIDKEDGTTTLSGKAYNHKKCKKQSAEFNRFGY